MGHVEFDRETLPWLDRCYAEIDAYAESLDHLPEDYDLRDALIHWVRFGYVAFPKLIDEELIDAFVDDVTTFLADPSDSDLFLTVEGYGVRRARELPPEAFAHHHSRLMDFHNLSVAGKHLALHPGIVGFLQHVFRTKVVAMQSLTFVHSTEQSAHQDFPYVTSEIVSHLAATWIALEDVHPDAGPLFYHPGSHTVRKFDWGNGLALTPESTRDEQDFARHLDSENERRGHEARVFCPRKGDVFFWHAALVHGGSPVVDRSLTRMSFVTHYSSDVAYRTDRRTPDREPVTVELNGGILFADQRNLREEDRFRLPR